MQRRPSILPRCGRKRRQAPARSASVVVSALLLGCATDSVVEPDPTFDTSGAFVAMDAGGGSLTLVRTLDLLRLENETLLFVTRYDVHPKTWEEAGDVARRPDLPILVALDALPEAAFLENEIRVVWFRTLTDEEEELL
jgi:hypothetical protein